jgi:hypothetical protein
VFASSVCGSWFKLAVLDATARRHMITPMTSPGSTENNNTLVAGGIRREQVAELEGISRFMCIGGGLHTSYYVGQATCRIRL